MFAGEEAGSEPETRAIQDFILSKKSSWLSFVSIHSYGAMWLHHWESNHSDLNRAAFLKLVKFFLLDTITV